MRVELRNIHKHFGPVHANAGITLTFEEGKIHGLLGENGAGKSTLMKILSGFYRPDEGEIYLDGRRVSFHHPSDALRQGVGMLHQDPLDFPVMTVLENFMAGSPGGMVPDKRKARKALKALGEQFGFHLDPDATVASLTVGERQQLEILRLLWLGARVLIFDEPTTGISAQQKERLFQALRRLAAEGRTIIFVTHKLYEVQELCDTAAVLRLGKLMGQRTAPYDLDDLVKLMFGRVLKMERKPPIPLGEPIFRVEDLAVESARVRIRNVHLEVRAGEVIGLAGMEGSGQRFLLRACAGLLRPTSGRVWFHGREMTGRSYLDFYQAGATYLPATRLEEGLLPGLRVADHLLLARGPRGFFVNEKHARDLAEAAIRTFNIRGRPDSMVEALSGGNQQRLLLSLLRPNLSLLFLEHPTRGLDMESTLWVWEQLLERCRQGTAIFFMSSDLDELLNYSDRILVFFAGQVSAPLPAEDLDTESLGRLIGGYGFVPVEEAQTLSVGEATHAR